MEVIPFRQILNRKAIVNRTITPKIASDCQTLFDLFSNARKRVFSTVETARGWGLQREVMGSDERGREGGDEGGATKDRASTDMPRDASDGRVSGLVSP